jgi:hypothetical protein
MGRRSPKSLKMLMWRKIMRSTPSRLLFRKKITAIFADGSSKMNLGIATVVRMLKGATNVPVEVAANAAARKLLAELARSAGRTVERASAGIFLTPSVVQPGVNQRAVPAVPVVAAAPADLLLTCLLAPPVPFRPADPFREPWPLRGPSRHDALRPAPAFGAKAGFLATERGLAFRSCRHGSVSQDASRGGLQPSLSRFTTLNLTVKKGEFVEKQ